MTVKNKVKVNYLDKTWFVVDGVDFCQQVQEEYKNQFPTGWAYGLSQEEYERSKAIYDAIQLKALCEFWKSRNQVEV